MKPFSLNTVLNHRKNLENQAIHQLAKAQEEESSVRQQLLKEENSLSNLIAAMANEQAQGIEVVKLSQFEQRIILIENQVQDLRSLLQKKKEKVNQAHGHMVARSKERKIMETLQQKQNEAWQQYLMQKETATLDEIAVIFHNRE